MSKYELVKKNNYEISEESATEQLMKLLEYYDIDISQILNEDAKTGFERAMDAVVDYIRKGVVEITEGPNDTIQVVQHLKKGEMLTYGELGARHKLAMDKVKPTEQYRRMYALMGSLSGVGSAGIEKLSMRDLSVVEVLSTVFSNA